MPTNQDRKHNPADTLAEKARSLRLDIIHALKYRQQHGGHGLRKSEIRADFHRLEGLLYAWAVVAYGEASPNFNAQVEQAAMTGLGISTAALRQQVEEAR